MTTARRSLARSVVRLLALDAVKEARIRELEVSNRELRLKAGLEAPDPLPGPEMKTAKQVAYETGYSPSYVRKWMANGTVEVVRRGGRALVVAASVPPPRSAKRTRERTRGRA